MPIVIGLDSDVEWSNPLNLSSGAKSGFGLDGTSAEETKSAPAASSRDWNDIVDTVIAEAAGEGDEGMAAVASVIKNRAGVRGKTAAEVVREPDQFTGYSKPGDAAKKAMQDPDMRRRAEAVVASVFSGERPDATGGADHYHATSVAPDWATKMPRTTQVGNHLFYNSKGDRARPEDEKALGLTAVAVPERSEAESAFDAVLTESSTRVPNPEGKGLARLVRPQPDAPAGTGGALSFVHKGQDKIDPAFSSILVDTSKSMGRNFTITSGYRGPSHPVEARKKNPGQHSHGTAADISMRGMDDAQRAQLVTELRSRGVKRFGTYTNEPDMLHVDMKDQAGNGTTWFMHDTTNKRLAKAPEWFQELSRQPAGSPVKAAEGGTDAKESGGIVIDENFTSDNPGMMAQATQLREARAQREAEAQAAAEQQRIDAKTGSDNAAVAARQQELNADRADRYQVIDEAELPAWQKKWDEENRSTGVMGDTGRILKSGVIGLGQSVTSLADTVFRRLPGGEKFLEASDAIDRWALGETFDSKLDTAQDRARATVTPEQQAADAKNWWDTDKGWFGPAWRDPRSYLRGVGESAPGTVVTMLPGGILARGKYLAMLAGGAEQKVAAAAAAKVATVAGAVSEGLVGGADSTRNVRDRIAQIPREQLAQSETVRILVEGGMSEGDAIKALTEDAATQAFVISGVATGMFGGFGDRALARIIAEGVGGGVVRRVLAGAARGSVAEGVFEELPQGVAQQISDNAAIQRVDPSQSLTEGVEEAAAAGVATGGAMGGGMGAAGGAASRRPSVSATVQETPQAAAAQPATEQQPQSKGPLGRAVAHGEQESRRRMDEHHAAERQQLEAILGGKTANAHIDEMLAGAAADIERERAGAPEIGATVRVDAEGMEPILGRVESYDGDEALVFDSGTGEVYQVPVGSLTKTADSVDRQAAALRAKQAEPPMQDALPEESSDEALRPLEPRAAETTTEIPPASEQKPATEKRPTRPQPGGRVIVEGPDGDRFPARIERYEDEGAEAVVIDDHGKPYQVPVESLSVSALTPEQVEQQELERNPPIEREPADAGPNSRRVGESTVVLPDEKHAHLYDLAREQIIAKKLGGTSQVDMSKVLPAERKRLADEFGVSVEDLASMADDYRYRVERAAKEAKSKLPVQMHQVNERLLKQRQTARAKQEPETAATKDEAGQWWDVELTAPARKRVLDEAGVHRNERVMWGNLTPGIQKKLLAVRDAERGTDAVEHAAPAQTDIASADPAPVTAVDDAAHEAATSPSNDLPEPTQAQKEAGNYKVGRIRLGGLDISIENPSGSERKGTSSSGKAWSVKMKSHYGYIRGTVGRDKDHIDIFVKPGTETLDDSAPIFVVDQRDPARGRFDEHKVMAGFASEEEARAAYLDNYTSGWKGLGAISPTTLGEFKAWLQSGKTAEPFAPKWFGSRDKAEAHISKEKLGATHEVIESGKRFEIREKSAKPPTNIQKQSSEPENDREQGADGADVTGKRYEELYPTDEHAINAAIREVTRLHRGPKPFEDAIRKGASNKELLEVAQKLYGISGSSGPAYMVDTAETPAIRVNLYKKDGVDRVTLRGQRLAEKLRELFSPKEATAPAVANERTVEREVDGVAPRALFRSKEWKAAWKDTPAEQFSSPHPDSSVAYQMAKGWHDAKAGREPQRRPADGTKYRRDGHNPIDDYLMGYVAAREGKGTEIRGTDAEAVFGRYLADEVETPAAWEVEAAAKSASNEARQTSTNPKAKYPKLPVTENTVFTEDAAEKARALLRRKLSGSTLNSGIDPEILQAGVTLAGYHIEKGARTFVAYAQAMLADLGEDVRPYLKSWYMGVKYDPRAAQFDGMSSAAEVEGTDVADIAVDEGSASDEPAELDQSGSRALEAAPADQVSRAEAGRAARTGSEGSSGTDVSRSEPAGRERVSGRRGVADGQGDLLAAAERGNDTAAPRRDRRQPDGGSQDRSENSRDQVGPFGPILRGYEGKWREAALELERRQTGDALGALNHIEVGPIDLVWGEAGTNRHNGSGLAKLIAWHPEVLGDLQGFIDGLHVDREKSSQRRIQLVNESGRAGLRLDYDGTAKTWLLTAYSTDADRRTVASTQSLGELWKAESAGSGATSDTATIGSSDANASRRSGTSGNISDTLRDVQSAAVPSQQRPTDYVITNGDNLGEGGQKSKFRGNVAAIRLVRKLDEEQRPATRDEQSVLAKWVGWGGLRSAFYREDGTVTKGWEKEAKELKELLDSAEYASAESSTRNAHYTSPEIVNAAWDIARRLGFKGGQVLEPSVGAGNFLGLMPGEMRDGARITGVELDRITGGIAKNLYPGANIQTPIGFEKLTLPDNHFDLAIGNPPFGSERLYDKQRRNLNKFSIHNFFFAKSIETLRPGGVLAMVVTNRFLDGSNEAAREHIAQSADLVGAIRLPNNAFLKNAGTEVTTDIVILRKRLEGDKPDTSWTKVGEWKGKDGKAVPLNQYFIEKPEMMLGDFGAYGTMYGPDDPALVAREGEDLPALLAKAVRTLPENVMVEPGAAWVTETVTVPEGVNDVQVGAMFASPDGAVHIRMPDHLGQASSQAVEFQNDTAKERVTGMVRVRDAFAKLRRAQIDENAADAQIENLRKRLNTLYDGFVKKHGPINADANKRLFRDDPTWPQISALEQNFDKGISATVAQRTGEKVKPASAEKAAIFTKRTQQPYRRPTSASSAKDALATVLNDFGRVNLDAMSALYGKPVAAIVEELGPLLYKTPAGSYETADHYLSGNVKKKLAEAERAAVADPDFRRNVAALRDVQPVDIEAVDIDVKPGAPWIPANHIEDFIQRIGETGVRPRAFYSRGNAKWDIDVPSPSAPAATLWGTDRAGVGTILSAVLNSQSITITDRMSDGKTVVNQAATDAANEKAERVKAEWRKWLWENDARRDELVRIYNDTFNTDVLRSYDGSHLSLPGKVGDDIIEMRPHQKSFIWRSMQSGTALADHTVGAGKTFAAIASAMEKRRIGQARKPMFAVPNHLVGQWGADFVKLYPGAKVLATTEKDFEKENRKRLFARIATGDWDAVIVAHSSFGRIGMDPEYEAKFIQTQMDDLEESITALRRATGEKSRNVSQLTKWRDNLKAKMERLLDAGTKDDGLTFDELGVDALYVDEAHEFKNLAYSTSMQRVAGLGNAAGSQKAADLFMKSRFILERTNGNNVVFLTGTPLSNTMAEMFTVQRYLSEDTLRALGVSHFDAWAKVFGEVVTDWELSPSGQYKLNSRFAKFVNVPELMQHYLSFADVITNDDIKAQLAAIGKKLPLPKVRGGKPTNITVERSQDQATYIGEGKADENGNLVFPQGSIVWRAENLPKKQEKGKDNMLKVMSDARKAALDMRLVDAGYGDFKGSKVHRAADEMKRIHKKWEAKRGIQLVFIDLSTPKKAKAAEEARLRELIQKSEDGDEKAQEALDNMSPDEFLALQSPFSVYDDLRQKLIDRGVPPAEIAFIHDANTQAQKEELFGKVRSGRVRFLFGSTPKMGAGTNVQNRLVALHHIDAPWRPSDLEQRDGRGIRQGNELYAEDPDGFEIEILRYATKNTLDARTWQTIEAKARFIQQVRKGNLKTREIEDIAGEAANAAEMKAAASGNPLILEEMETRRRLRQLESQAVEHDREQHRIKSRVRSLDEEAASLRKRQPDVEADAARAAAVEKAPFAGTVKGETFDKPKDFGAAVIAAIRHELIDKEGVSDIGEYAGFKISIEHLHTREFSLTLSGARDYHVHVDDAADMDPTGTAMRITNTVRRLTGVPAVDRERVAEIEKQVPALEKQLGPWAGSKELEDTSARHRRLVEALRPKPKGKEATIEVTGNTGDDPEPARQNKKPDPVVSGSGGLKSAGTPSLRSDIPLRDAAIERVLDDGRRTGHEYLLAIDDDGSVVEYGTSGNPKATGMSNRLLSAMANSDRRIVIYHNHPGDLPLSVSDLANLAFPGIQSIWAVGHGGTTTRAAFTREAKEKFAGSSIEAIAQDQRKLNDALMRVEEQMRQFLIQAVSDGRITEEHAHIAHANARLLVAERANIIDFTTNAPYDSASLSDLDSLIDAAANRLAGEIFDDRKAAIRRSGGPTQPLRHIAELAPTPFIRAENVASRSSQAGFAETSSPDYQREDRGGEKARRVSEARIVEDLRGKLTDLQPALLKTIPLNYFSELARSNMTAVGEYMRVKRLMDAFRGRKHATADAIAQDWLKYTRLGYMGKDKAKAQELAELMHDTTLAGVDPSKVDKETKDKPGYEALRKRYMALAPAGKELYQRVRDAYAEQQAELDQLLLDNVRKAQEIAQRQAEDRYKRTLQRIKDAGLSGIDRRNAEEDAASAYKTETTKARWAAKARLTKMRIAFENSRVEEPYFPLGRFGRYFVTVRDIDGKVLSFSKFERAADRDREVRDMRRQFPNGKVEAGVMEQGSDLRRAMDPRIVAEIEELLGGAGVGAEIMDQIWQRYLESMPDLSTRKRFIHRKGTGGFSADALRVFSSHMFHAAHQMARMKYGLELQELVDQTFDQAKEADDPTRGVTLANELSNRHDWVMNPTGGKVAQTMTSVAFVWFLAGSVSAAMVNMTQTFMLGLPILGARFGGLAKAGAALGRASADSVRGKGSVVGGNLTADERRAMEAFYESGLIDRTQSHDLAGVGETGVEYTPLRAKVMSVISWMFHRAEVWNREVTALAAYRMARDAGQSTSDAIDTAHDLTWKTHFDYSNSSRPALMQNDFAKVALVFRQHNINMLYRVFRDIHQAFKGDTPNARREARYQLAGITGMMALMAGVTGTIGFNLLMGMASLILGDDDDPMDFEQKFRADVVDILGPELGGIVLNGAPGHYLGVDLSSRIGMPDLWFRSPTRELQGKAEYQYWLSQTLGATAGLGEQLFTGFRVMTDEGDVARGFEMMAPKPIRDLLKAYRYADEGVTTIGGDEVLPQSEVSAHDVVAQALGFTPARVSETYERNSSLKNAESRVRQKRQRLINRWAMAALMKDKEAAGEAIEAIKRFNAAKVNAGVAITKETLQRSIRTRAKNAAKREDGVLIQNEALGKELRDRLAEPIYR